MLLPPKNRGLEAHRCLLCLTTDDFAVCKSSTISSLFNLTTEDLAKLDFDESDTILSLFNLTTDDFAKPRSRKMMRLYDLIKNNPTQIELDILFKALKEFPAVCKKNLRSIHLDSLWKRPPLKVFLSKTSEKYPNQADLHIKVRSITKDDQETLPKDGYLQLSDLKLLERSDRIYRLVNESSVKSGNFGLIIYKLEKGKIYSCLPNDDYEDLEGPSVYEPRDLLRELPGLKNVNSFDISENGTIVTADENGVCKWKVQINTSLLESITTAYQNYFQKEKE